MGENRANSSEAFKVELTYTISEAFTSLSMNGMTLQFNPLY
jgi:hypothetical protein